MKGCGKQFMFKRDVVELEQETRGEQLFEEQCFMTECKEPLLCKECNTHHFPNGSGAGEDSHSLAPGSQFHGKVTNG